MFPRLLCNTMWDTGHRLIPETGDLPFLAHVCGVYEVWVQTPRQAYGEAGALEPSFILYISKTGRLAKPELVYSTWPLASKPWEPPASGCQQIFQEQATVSDIHSAGRELGSSRLQSVPFTVWAIFSTPWISFIYKSFRIMLNFQIVRCFPDVCLLLISNLALWWSDGKTCMISTVVCVCV